MKRLLKNTIKKLFKISKYYYIFIGINNKFLDGYNMLKFFPI